MKRTPDINDTIEKYGGTVFSVAVTHTRSRADAEDVFQEVFIALCTKKREFKDDEHLKAWLIRTSLNLSRKCAGSAWQRKTVALEEATQEDFSFHSDEQNALFSALRELPEKYRRVVHMFYFLDMPTSEIASVLHSREGTVRMQLSRAREMLKNILKEDFDYE